jgi:serine palmitoyltransferase
MDRTPVNGQKPLELTGTSTRCLNLGSYNYLGFGAHDDYCTPRVLKALDQDGWAAASSRSDLGTSPRLLELEDIVAEFLGKEAAITCGMGFQTNGSFIPVLAGRGDLIISDTLNHASIVSGVRQSGAKIRVFEHNNAASLESVLRAAIAEGQPRTGRPWKRVIIIIEGVYSMEGELANLKEIIEIKKKYKAYLYLDEAHSIGALGPGGAGVCEALGVDTADVDIMMGTFTKSFGSCGGYIAGDKQLINWLKVHSTAHLQATAMSSPAVEMVISAFKVIMGEDGSTRGAEKIAKLRSNSNYFRAGLLELGLNVLGNWDSPVMPIMVFHPGKLQAVSRLMLERHIAVVVVGFPATPLLTARMRVCISAAHTKEDLDFALEAFRELADACCLKYADTDENVKHVKAYSMVAATEQYRLALAGMNSMSPSRAVLQSPRSVAAMGGGATARSMWTP